MHLVIVSHKVHSVHLKALECSVPRLLWSPPSPHSLFAVVGRGGGGGTVFVAQRTASMSGPLPLGTRYPFCTVLTLPRVPEIVPHTPDKEKPPCCPGPHGSEKGETSGQMRSAMTLIVACLCARRLAGTYPGPAVPNQGLGVWNAIFARPRYKTTTPPHTSLQDCVLTWYRVPGL